MTAPVFAFGLVGLRLPRHGPGHHRGRLLRPGHRQRAVGLRALAHRDRSRTSRTRSRRTSASTSNFEKAKHFLEENDGAGNTFKATAKPVLIGTAVVGATTMIFSIIVALTHGLDRRHSTSCRCCTRPSCSASSPAARSSTGSPAPPSRRSSTGAYRAVEFIKAQHQARRRREGLDRRLARRSSRSARSTRRRACSTSSSPSSSRRWPSPASSRSSSSAT